MPKSAIYKLYIDGRWISSESRETYSRVNPANYNEPLGRFQQGNEKDVDKAVDAAEIAFEKWRDVPPPKRGEILFRVAQLLKENKEELARIMTREMGKVLTEARGDVQEAIDAWILAAGEGRRLFGRTTTSELRDKFAMTVRLPLGVVSCITPWNFPIAIPSWKLSMALICGNTVVLKPSSDTPICAVKLIEILEKAGVPKGVVNLVTGSGGSVGTRLVKHKKVRAVSFTGHKDTGDVIMKNVGVGKKLGMEMGSKNPIIVMDDADLKLALDGVIWGAFGTSGQRCTAASRVIVHKKIKQKFERMLVERTNKLRLGSGLDLKTDIGPLVNKAAQDKVAKYLEIGKQEGAKLCCGGKIPKLKGWFVQPTVFTDTSKDMKIFQDEIFGPVTAISEANSLDHAIDLANAVEYGLSSSIYTNDIRRMMLAIKNLEYGITYINTSTIGAEVHLPFGGTKVSGSGWKEMGWSALDFYSDEKTVFVDYSGKLQRAQIDID
ncbi:MAG: aldehyde dehydrogenase family protein [Candidatus Aenigmarchaeota archaeon]|nr:aldehyde dehydrogenase family protein [Candidatus Aenigmarchaeota archaeon]